ncbi:MAG: nucleotidyltransferase domain-containing protein [Cyclobacteriaceae bacterium]
MDTMIDDQIANEIKKKVNSVDPNSETYLFGSRARKENRSNSDWDILILVDDKKVTNDVEDKFRNELYEIELETGQLISPIIYPKDYWNDVLVHTPLYASVKREGILL